MSGIVNLTFNVDNITQVVSVFNKIEVRKYKYPETSEPTTPVTDAIANSDYETLASGTDVIGCQSGSSVSNTTYVELCSAYDQYYFTDYEGEYYDWYISRYINTGTGATSGWTDPVLGEVGDIFYDPLYPDEVTYGSEDTRIIDRIRRYIGDPKGLRREYGEDAASSIHPDGKTYEMDERGWPALINMRGIPYNNINNPTVNGYRFLRFQDYIDIETTITGSNSTPCDPDYYTHGVDIWYYTFRNSDRQIMDAYDNCPIPAGLTSNTVTTEAYILQTAINILIQENWEDAFEDGAVVTDETTRYDPSPGLRARKDLLDFLQKKLDKLVTHLQLRGIEGVLID